MSDTDITQIQGPRDLFSIRSQLAQQANPLRAKMVLFSVLYRPFAYSSGDWSTLKQQDLGEFIRRVYNKYATPDELQNALMLITAQLDNPADCDHAAAAILKLLRPYYTDVEPMTGDRADLGEDLDVSQTWDIPIGVSLKDLNDAPTEIPVTGAPSIDRPVSDVGSRDAADLLTTGFSSATTAGIAECTVALEMDDVDGLDNSDRSELFDRFDQSELFDESGGSGGSGKSGGANPFDKSENFEDSEDDSASDHSRWLDSSDVNSGASDFKSQPRRAIEPQASDENFEEDFEKFEPTIEPQAELPIAATPPTNDQTFRADRQAPKPPNTPPKRNGRRTGLAQLLTQHVSSREEVDAIVLRYSKTLTEQVTTALDNLEDELAECLTDRDAEEATSIAGEALGRVLLSVSDSIEQMRQALESIPGVEPISTSARPYTQPPQRSNPPVTSEPTPPPATATQNTEEARLPIVATPPIETTPPPQTPQPTPPPAIVDPVQRINEHFHTLLAKRDMSIFVKQRHGCVHLIAEASPLPERHKLVRFVTKNLKQLDLPPISALRLHGRRKDARAFDWSEDLPPIG